MGWGSNVLRKAQTMEAQIDAIATAQATLKSNMDALSAGADAGEMTTLRTAAASITTDLATLAAIVVP